MVYFPARDRQRRQVRFDLLRAAAFRAGEAGRASGIEVLVTGSVARGEVHPWSDLDLLLRMPAQPDLHILEQWKLSDLVERASGLPEGQIDTPFEDEIAAALRPGMVGGAVSLEAVPTGIGDLPDPDLPLRHSAMGAAFAADHYDRTRRSLEGDIGRVSEESGRYLVRSHTERALTVAQGRCLNAVKRLAAHHDGGLSPWLDDRKDRDAFRELLGRLASPTEEPFPRPALVPEESVRDIERLIFDFDPEEPRTEASSSVRKDAEEIMKAVRAWAERMAGCLPSPPEPMATFPTGR